MSHATQEGLLVLVAVNGACKVLADIFSRVDLKKLARETSALTEYAMAHWREAGNPFQNTAWVTGVFTEWYEACFEDTTKHKAAVLVTACGMLVSDQDDKVRDKSKKRILKDLADRIATMQDFTDANWLNFPALDEAKRVADKLTEIAKENEGVQFKVVRERRIEIRPKNRDFRQRLQAFSEGRACTK